MFFNTRQRWLATIIGLMSVMIAMLLPVTVLADGASIEDVVLILMTDGTVAWSVEINTHSNDALTVRSTATVSGEQTCVSPDGESETRSWAYQADAE